MLVVKNTMFYYRDVRKSTCSASDGKSLNQLTTYWYIGYGIHAHSMHDIPR